MSRPGAPRGVSSSADQSRHGQVLDDCFRWAVVTEATRSSDFVQAVAGYLAGNMRSVDAVERALDDLSFSVLDRQWCARGHELYSPAQVLPFLKPYLTWGVSTPGQRLISLAAWVHSQVTWVSDERKWHAVDHWQPPAQTLAHRSGDCEDQALVLWSALPLLGLPTGELVVGTLHGRGHAWVELPLLSIPLIAEATSGEVYVRSQATGYAASLRITPNACRSA